MMPNESNNLSGIGKDLKALFSAMEEKMLTSSVEEKIHFAFTIWFLYLNVQSVQ